MSFPPPFNTYNPGNSSCNSGSSFTNNYSQEPGNVPSPVAMFYRKNGSKIAGYSNKNHNSPTYYNKSPRNLSFNNFPSYNNQVRKAKVFCK